MSELKGPFGWMTPAIAAMSRADPEFWRHVVHMDRAATHTLGLILSHCDTGRWQAHEWRSLAHALQFAPRKALAGTFAPAMPVPCVKLLPKLRGSSWRAASYRRLSRLYGETHARKWLVHARAITRRDLLVLECLPRSFRMETAVRHGRRRADLGELLYTIAVARRVRTDLTDRQIARAIEQSGAAFKPQEFQEQMVKHARFPDPPWDGDGMLVPVRCYSDLEAAGRAFRNCLEGYLFSILERYSAIYVYWSGDRAVGVVELRPNAVFGWELGQARGPRNNKFPYAAYPDMVRRLRAAGFSAGLMLDEPATLSAGARGRAPARLALAGNP